MEYGLIWVGLFAAGLLLMGLIVNLSARLKKPLWRKVWPIVAFAVIIIPFAFITTAAGEQYFHKIEPRECFWFLISLTLFYIIGFSVILKISFKDIKTNEPSARFWPWKRHLSAFIIISLSVWFVLTYLHHRLVNEMDKIDIDATCRLSSLLPQNVPDSLNAYALYTEAAQSLNTNKPSWLRHLKSNIEPAEMSEFLRNQQHTLALLHQAATRPYYKYDVVSIPVPYGPDPVPDMIIYRDFAYLLSHAARVKAGNGEISGALRDLDIIKIMTKHLSQYPCLISAMWIIAIDGIRVYSLEFVLANAQNVSVKQFVLPVKEDKSSLELTQKTFITERLFSLQMMADTVNTEKSTEPVTTDNETFFKKEPFYSRLNVMNQLGDILILQPMIRTNRKINYLLAKPVKNYQEFSENIENALDATATKSGLLSTISVPLILYTSFLHHVLTYDARQGLANIALATTAYKNATGHYPQKLDELVPQYIEKIPMDPFDNKPLKMKTVKGGVDLYSAGFNDTYGKPTESWQKKEPIHFYLGKEAYYEYISKPAGKEKKQYGKSAGK